jgi:hypothetical protein
MSESKTVTLDEKEYQVPPLVPRQLRVVVPALMRLAPLAGDSSKLTTQLYDDMLLILYWGAVWPSDKKTDQGSGIQKLLDLPISFSEMTAAMKVIRDQTGLFQDASTEGAQPGEATNP